MSTRLPNGASTSFVANTNFGNRGIIPSGVGSKSREPLPTAMRGGNGKPSEARKERREPCRKMPPPRHF